MRLEECGQLIRAIDDLWPGVTDRWSQSSIIRLQNEVMPYTLESAMRAVTALQKSDRMSKRFQPDPADVIRFVTDLGTVEQQQLPERTSNPIPWDQASMEIFGEIVPLSEAPARLAEGADS